MKAEDAEAGGLAWDSPEVQRFVASLPKNMRLRRFTTLPAMPRANLKQCFVDAARSAEVKDLDVPAPPDVALKDMQTIVDELDWLPPLLPPEQADELRASLKACAERGLFSISSDSSGAITSPSGAAIRAILAGPTHTQISTARTVFERLTRITRSPPGSAAPGDASGPPSRVTIRNLSEGMPSTLGEPKHCDGKPASPLGPPPPGCDGMALAKRPVSAIFSFRDGMLPAPNGRALLLLTDSRILSNRGDTNSGLSGPSTLRTPCASSPGARARASRLSPRSLAGASCAPNGCAVTRPISTRA